MSKPFTLAFSNTPGILQEIKIKNTQVEGLASLVVPGGRVGICISIISFVDGIRVSATADTSIMNKKQLETITKGIE